MWKKRRIGVFAVRLLRLTLEDSQRPVYHRIADAVREALRDGRVSMGTLLPSTRLLAGEFEVHRHTVSRALDELVAEGWLEPEPGRGYRAVAPPATELGDVEVSWPQFTVARELSPREDGEYRFPSGQPDLRLFPRSEFFRILRTQLREADPTQLLGYSDPAGSLEFRNQLKTYLGRMRGVKKGQVVVTHGSQEAIFLLGQLFAKGERKTIAVEEMGYRPAWDALRLSGARLVGLPVDEEGLVVDRLEELARHEPPALLYLTPLHQYPTTVALSVKRRQQLLSLIARYEIPVIEDDYDHEFHYTGRPHLPLAGEDESGLVVYVSTFSKLVYPSARLGFCVVDEELLGPLCRLKRCTTRQNDLLFQGAMSSWMADGGLERHLRRMRKIYQRRLELMSGLLREAGMSFRKPHGGMSLWVDLGVDSDVVVRYAEEEGLRLRPGRAYALDAKREVRHLRLGFASSDESEMIEGLELLIRAWKRAL
jgi:GntR family transcriptional regulator/MocR family aminotransferase